GWRDQDWLPGADGDPNGTGEIVPELADSRVCRTPLANDGCNFLVGPGILRHDPAPGAYRSTKTCRQFSCFAGLTFGAGDFRVGRLVQHFACNHPVRLERSVAGLLECLVGVEFPAFTGEPGQYNTLDRTEVAALKLHAFAGTERSARDVAQETER